MKRKLLLTALLCFVTTSLYAQGGFDVVTLYEGTKRGAIVEMS